MVCVKVVARRLKLKSINLKRKKTHPKNRRPR
jgi:hypothetical protein